MLEEEDRKLFERIDCAVYNKVPTGHGVVAEALMV
jgi:hypothetical protein